MQAEINSQETLRAIQILGVDRTGLEFGIGDMFADWVLPWLRPVTGEDVWTLWQVDFRDVIILGPGNEQLGTFNLTVNDLSDTVNYAALKNQLLEAADE